MTWQCQTCLNATQRKKTNDTGEQILINTPVPNANTMLREITYEEPSTSKETQQHPISTPTQGQQTDTPTLEAISNMFDTKLRQNNHNIMTQIKKTLRSEVNKAVKDLQTKSGKDSDKLPGNKETHKDQIEHLNRKIATLEIQIKMLQLDTERIQKEINKPESHATDEKEKKTLPHSSGDKYEESYQMLNCRLTKIFSRMPEIREYVEDTPE